MPETANCPLPEIAVLAPPEIPEPTFSTPELSVPASGRLPANTSCPWFLARRARAI